MAVGSHIQGLYPSELVPLLPRVLVSFDVFPSKGKRRATSHIDDLVDDVVFGAQRGSGEGCLGGDFGLDPDDESQIVGSDPNSW